MLLVFTTLINIDSFIDPELPEFMLYMLYIILHMVWRI